MRKMKNKQNVHYTLYSLPHLIPSPCLKRGLLRSSAPKELDFTLATGRLLASERVQSSSPAPWPTSGTLGRSQSGTLSRLGLSLAKPSVANLCKSLKARADLDLWQRAEDERCFGDNLHLSDIFARYCWNMLMCGIICENTSASNHTHSLPSIVL